MKKIYFIFIVLFLAAFFSSNAQSQNTEVFKQEGIASWYGKEFEGRPTASGEIFNPSQLTAAHPSLPFGTMLVITNQHNNKKVTVRVNDRGPFVAARIVDVSRAAAEQLDMIITGTAPVLIESIDRIVISNPVKEPVVSPLAQPVVSIYQPAVTNTENTVMNVSQPVITRHPNQIILTPQINIVPNKNYRLQVGSYRVAKNAVDAYDKLKDSGLNPAYERFTDSGNIEYFRVVLAGVRGTDVQSIVEKLGIAGFKEALIREEN